MYRPQTLTTGRGVWGGLEGFDFKLFHEDVGYEGADGGFHSCSLCLLVILTLEEEVGLGETELQEGGDLGDGHGHWTLVRHESYFSFSFLVGCIQF